MTARKLNDEQIKRIIEYRLEGYRNQSIANMYHRGLCTIEDNLRIAYKRGIVKKSALRKAGRKIVTRDCIRNLGRTHEELVERSKIGGKNLHYDERFYDKGENARENLSNGYRKTRSGDKSPFKFGRRVIIFDSKFEREVALFLLEAGLIHRIIPGKNYHVHLESTMHGKRDLILDFVINKGKNKYVIEAHTLGERFIDDIEEKYYEEKRIKELGLRDGTLELIVVRKDSDFYKLIKTFMPRISDNRYHDIGRTVKKRIKRYDKKDKKPRTVEERLRESGVPEWLIDA